MANITFGDMSIDMRQDTMQEFYGVADMQSLYSFLLGFYPVGEQVLIESNTTYRSQFWDSAYNIVTVTLEGDFSSYYVSSVQVVAQGIVLEVGGDLYVNPDTLEITGTLRTESVHYESGGLIADISGLDFDVSLFFSTIIPDLSDATMLAGNDTITAGNGSDYLRGYAGNDSLVGGSGNDTLDGGAGRDTLVGGPGDDTYRVDDSGDMVVEGASAGVDAVIAMVSHVLGANVENLTLGGTAAINATGNAGNNVITGNAGNNILDGAGGNDTLAGGAGNDTYLVNSAGKQIVEAAGAGVDIVRAALSHTLAAHVENLVLTGTLAIDGHGNAEHNRLTGNGAANTLYGHVGDDTLNGGAGVDTLWGGKGNDTYVLDDADLVKEVAGEGRDTVKASVDHVLASYVENLILTGTANLDGSGNGLANMLTGNAGANWLQGAGGADTLLGNGGNDTLSGGLGVDSMAGGAGNDVYEVDAAGDVVKEALNGGLDLVRSSVGYTLGANVEQLTLLGIAALDGTGNLLANRIQGNGGANPLKGLLGNDTLVGGSGNDTLMGGAGKDVLTGGPGKDHFVFDTALNGGANLDTITSFTSGGDKVVLDAAVFTAIGAEGNFIAGDSRFYAAAGATEGHDATDRVIYDTATGALYYDPDGSGAMDAVQFAQVGDPTPAVLVARDILVI